MALGRLAQGRTTPQKVALRARIILLSADGAPTEQIMARLATTTPTISRWRERYRLLGVPGIVVDRTRPGRRPRITEEQVREVVERTLGSTPVNATHWSTRTMAQATGLSKATIQRIWKTHGLQPAPERDVQALSRPAIPGQAQGRDRALPGPAGEGDCLQRG